MPDVIADSAAVLLRGRVLAQHQSALVLVRERTQNPDVKKLKWLDLACGRGQILVNVENVIPEKRRQKIDYLGFDVSLEHARDTEKRACSLFSNGRVKICELACFENFLDDGESFDFITLTNTVHEISPEDLARTIVAALCRAKPDGCVFLYDMETLPTFELGAIPWSGEEVESIIHQILTAAGVPAEALPDVAIWPHKSCQCWNLQVHRNHFAEVDLVKKREAMIAIATRSIRSLLEEKLLATSTALDSAARFGSETTDEEREILRLLYDYWAISRALGLPVEAVIAGPRDPG